MTGSIPRAVPEPGARRHDLDALRGFAMLLGIALHAGLSFVEFPWVVQDSRQHALFGVFFLAVHAFRMPLFFLLSGFFTAMLWRNRGMSRLIRHRWRRIVLPLLLGLVTVTPTVWAVIILAGTSRP
ncbi:MAG: acyltransferase family protein, partial [Planctomycetota bacterium]